MRAGCAVDRGPTKQYVRERITPVLWSSARVVLDRRLDGARMFKDLRTRIPSLASRDLAPRDATVRPFAPPERTSAGPGLHLQAVGLRAWIEGPAKPEVLLVGPGAQIAVPLERALQCLLSSDEPLAPAHGRALGLADDASIATAASRLLEARFSPYGPRCRSFRAASYFLVGLARLEEEDATTDLPVDDATLTAGAA